jgi:hypothetical protein
MTVSTLPSILKKMEMSGWQDCHLCKRWKFPSYKWQNAIQDASSFYVNNGTTYSCTVRTCVRCAQLRSAQQYISTAAAVLLLYTPPVFVPFNATPTVALYDLTFANTMANIDPVYDNDTLVLGFGTNFRFQNPAANDNFINTPYDKDGDTEFTTEAQV